MNYPLRKSTLPIILLFLYCCTAASAETRTIESAISPPDQFARVPVKAGTFAASLRQLELLDSGEVVVEDGRVVLCGEDEVAITTVKPFDNENDVGVDGIVRMWGDYLWKNHRRSTIAFPLDNGQLATWKDWKDGLRPKKKGGKFIFTQITTPDGSYGSYQRFLSFVAEEMGALALKRESRIVLEDSLQVGDLMVAVRPETDSRVGIILDICKGPKSEKLYLIGICGTPSTNLYVMRPFAPVQGLHEWFTLDGAKWAIGEGDRIDCRRVSLTRN